MDYKNVLKARLFLYILIETKSCASSSGHGIWEHLFLNNSYNNEVRPVKQWSTPATVNVSMAIVAVVEFNEVKQSIVLATKLTLEWKDEYLVWDPLKFENISHIHLSQSKVWKPYIFLENSVSKQSEIGTPSLQVIVTNDGTVEWNPVEVFHATCAADVRKFPFDTQKCSMVFESLGYTGAELRMNSVQNHIDFHGPGTTSGWSVAETEIRTEADEGSAIHILCSLTLRRNPTYFILNIILPIVILSIMNTSVFILPVQSGEKASFVITVFLSLAVFLTIVSSNLPENTDKVSILNVYVFICTLLSVLIAILTIIQIRIYHRDPGRKVSPGLTKLAVMFTSKQDSNVARNTRVNASGKEIRRKNTIVDVAPLDNVDGLKNNADFKDVPCNVKVTWPDVVRAFDNIFLVMFSLINLITTTVIFIMAVRSEELPENHESH